jgi:hypothetical protein
VAKPWWSMEIHLALKLAREWKSKAKQELIDTNTILAVTSKHSTKPKETSKTKSNKRRKNGFKNS